MENEPLMLGAIMTLVGSVLMVINKMLDKLPRFKNGDHKALSDIAKSLEPIRDVICGDYSRRDDGTFKIHNLPEREQDIKETREIVAKVDDRLAKITGE